MLNLGLRFLLARRLRTILSILSVVLGNGLMAALLTLSATMEKALDDQMARNFGTFDLMAGYHQPGKVLSPAHEAAIRQIPGVVDVAGILIPTGMEPGLIAYGVPNSPLGHQLLTPKEGTYPGPGEVAISEAWVRMRNLTVGDTAELPLARGQTVRVRISGLLASLKTSGTQVILERAWLERTVGQEGATFTLIELTSEAEKAPVTNAIQDAFPEVTVYNRDFLKEIRRNLDALRPVAYGLGIASLLASAFLLTGAFRISLAERTRELAVLRAIAATPRQIRRMLLAEGLLVGLTGSLLGLLLGAAGAIASGRGVAAALGVEPTAPSVPVTALAAIGLIGTLLALVSARGVAKAAGQVEPLRAMRPDLPNQEQAANRGGIFGLILMGAGLVAVATVPFWPAILPGGADGLQALTGSTGALAVGIGLLLATQRLLPLLLPVLALPFRSTSEGPLAVRSILRHRRRSSLTTGAMSLGLIMVIAIATIMGTLARNMEEQIRTTHPADLQVSLPGLIHQGLNPAILDQIQRVNGVSQVGFTYDNQWAVLVGHDWAHADPTFLAEMAKREVRSRQPFLEREFVWAAAGNMAELVSVKAYTLLAGSVAQLGPNDLVLQKKFADSRGFALGDSVRLNLQREMHLLQSQPIIHEFRVAAIVEGYHYALPQVILSQPIPDDPPPGVRMIFANAVPEKRQAVRDEVRAIATQPEYSMAEYSDAESALAEMRSQINQRYALVVAVALVMAAVAAMSLINTMVGAINERRREFALLRSVGATPGQVRRAIMLEGGLLGLVGGIVGGLGGVILASGALYGLEPERFDKLALPWAVLAAGLLLSVGLSLLAALGPARRVATIAPAEALRLE